MVYPFYKFIAYFYDMNLYKVIIEKGGLFGIICVCVLIIINGILKKVKERSTERDPILIAILNFLNIFFVGSLIYISIVYITDYEKSSSNTPNHSTKSIAQRIEPIKEEKIFKLGPYSEIAFTTSGDLAIVQSTYSFSSLSLKADTIEKVPISSVSLVEIDEFEEKMQLAFRNGLPDFKIIQCTKLKKTELYTYIQTLRSLGYDIDVKYKAITTMSIIGWLLFVLSVIGLVLMLFRGEFGCSIFSIMFVIALVLISIARC